MAELAKKQEEALLRQAARVARTPAQQLALLDQKLGTGLGAARERARIAAAATKARESAPTATPPKKS